MAAVLSAKEVAVRLDTDPRTLRKFLRHDAKQNETETPGKGGRYSIEAKKVASLGKRFHAWDEARHATPEVAEPGDVHEDETE